ncbi:MAG TPA: DNA repair protein RadC [Longimicrobiaceae bacterium]|nr:DNA repair protein RadC [Longimicrobiaceae bacterium]
MSPTTYPIKQWPTTERPRERLERLGPRALASRELLALLIETGTPAVGDKPARSALDLAVDLLNHFRTPRGTESLRRVMTADLSEVCNVAGIGPAKAAKILAALDLGRRACEEARPERERVKAPRDVYERYRYVLRDQKREIFHVLLVNGHNEILFDLCITDGTALGATVHPSDVFRRAIVEGASGIILVHNHPSGDPTPSEADEATTDTLRRVGETVGIPVLDHIIVGEGRFISFVDAGYWPAE